MYDKVKKVLLLVLAALVALFGVLYWRSAAGPEGVAYRDVLYFPTQEPDALVYTGKADGQTVSYAVGSDGSVTCRVGETVHGPYTIREDPSAVPDENWDSGLLTGIQISAGGAVLFRGGYFPQAGLLIREDGTALWGSAFHQSGTDREGPDLEAVLDVVYNPFRTELILRAEELGIPAYCGFEMLVAQAVGSAGGIFVPTVSRPTPITGPPPPRGGDHPPPRGPGSQGGGRPGPRWPSCSASCRSPLKTGSR